MSHPFYPFLDEQTNQIDDEKAGAEGDFSDVRYAARIAIYDDPSVTPRVEVVEPRGVREYLDEITALVYKLAHDQGGVIPFTVIREVVENFIHAYFIEPTISILDGGNTIRFSDQGPGIDDKSRALEYGTTSATAEMKHYIRGVGFGLPSVQQYMQDKGGILSVEDNLGKGTIVTISMDSSFVEKTRGRGEAKGEERDKHPHEVVLVEAGELLETLRHAETPQMRTLSVDVDKRGHAVLEFLDKHEAVGPSDLVRTYGGSNPTWSRTLKSLENEGFLLKRGQKRYLTKKGRGYLSDGS